MRSTPWYLTKCDWDHYKESAVFLVMTMLRLEVRVIMVRFPGRYLPRMTVGPSLVKAAGTWNWQFIPSNAQVKNKISPIYIPRPGTALDWWLVAPLSECYLNFFGSIMFIGGMKRRETSGGKYFVTADWIASSQILWRWWNVGGNMGLFM